MTDEERASELLGPLRKDYASRLPVRARELRAAVEAAAAGALDREALHALTVQLHRLIGSGATYGFPRVSAAARALEPCVTAFTPGGVADPADAGRARAAAAELEEAARDAATGSAG